MAKHIKQRPIRVLLVGDSSNIRRALVPIRSCETRRFIASKASTRTQALAAIQARRPHVVVLDVQLGSESGIEACRDIRTAYPDVNVLFLTDSNDLESIRSAMLAGANGHLTKVAHRPPRSKIDKGAGDT